MRRDSSVALRDIRREKLGGSYPGCPFIMDMLSYEMIRVEVADADETRLRPKGMSAARVGCGG